MPLGFTLLEPDRRRARWMWPVVGLGVLLGAYLRWQVTAYPVVAQQQARCIDYTTHTPNDALIGVLYVVGTCGPALMSSRRHLPRDCCARASDRPQPRVARVAHGFAANDPAFAPMAPRRGPRQMAPSLSRPAGSAEPRAGRSRPGRGENAKPAASRRCDSHVNDDPEPSSPDLPLGNGSLRRRLP